MRSKVKHKIAVKFAVLISIAAIVLLCFAMFPSRLISAEAGASKSYIASEASIRGERINSGDFFVNGGVYALDGRAVFPANDGEEDVSLVSKNKIENMITNGVADLIKSAAKVRIEKLGDGGKVSFAYGLDSFRKRAGAENSFEVALVRDKEGRGVAVCVTEYRVGGAEINVLDSYQPSIDLEQEFTLSVYSTVNAEITVSLNGKQITSGRRLGVDPTGYVSISSVGDAEFSVSDLDIYGYKYNAPETLDIEENFDNGEYNANLLYSQATAGALSPARLSVEDGKLRFHNTELGYLSTRYQYSNFEMSFDLVDLRREAGVDSDGNTVGISSFFGIVFGEETVESSVDSVIRHSTWLSLEGIPVDADHSEYYPNARYVMWENFVGRPEGIKTMNDFNVWDNSFVKDRVVKLRFTLIDGVVKLYLRFDGECDMPGEEEYYEENCYYEFDFGQSKTGYVKLFSYGPAGAECNFTIDNFSVKNMDSESAKNQAAYPGYKSPIVAPTEDFDYNSTANEDDLLANKIKNGTQKDSEDGGCSSSIGVSCTVAAVAVLAVCAALIGRRKHEEKY